MLLIISNCTLCGSVIRCEIARRDRKAGWRKENITSLLDTGLSKPKLSFSEDKALAASICEK